MANGNHNEWATPLSTVGSLLARWMGITSISISVASGVHISLGRGGRWRGGADIISSTIIRFTSIGTILIAAFNDDKEEEVFKREKK